jgi:N-acetylated-alpha-linked acidic dipeptidase
MKNLLSALVLLCGSLSAQAPSKPAQLASPSILGFTPQGAREQSALESEYKSMISPASARDFHRIFTAEPHPAGSERNHKLAEYVAEQWKAQGLEDVVIHRYDALTSLPKEVSLEMISPVTYKAELREQPITGDPDTKNPDVRGAYTSMSASGEVIAPIVYAHSGNPEDYELLRQRGIDVRGKVVLVRYSNPYSYRGFKALTAQRLGVAALLIYSDPAEDGYKKGKVFPAGPWGPEHHLQRGAITYDFIVAGDPLTPGWASVPGAKRIPIEEATSMPHIMAMPLSWHDAKPLLEHMGGARAPKSWQGGLPITYRFGGEGRVHVKIDMDTRPMPNYVVEARVRGAELPDEWIVLGNHRDAWEFGGVDPSSGTASMMEMTRAVGRMVKDGKRPRRTIVVCSWDGEEVGLTGSTEWGEEFADQLKKKLVAYINVDSSTAGPNLTAGAVGSLAPMLVETTKTLRDPKTGVSLYEAWKRSAQKAVDPGPKTAKKPRITDADLVNTKIGSGSDHTVFLNHLGRPTMLLEFDGPYGVYHSVYDDFYWMNHFGDPGYRYHALMSELWGVVALRLANARALPFDVANYAHDVHTWIAALAATAKKDPQGSTQVDFARALHAANDLQSAGAELDRTLAARLAADHFDASTAAAVNAQTMQVESNWLNPEGIPGRPWFQHQLYAARYTYAHLELPGVTEAIEAKDWKRAQQQLDLLEAAIRKNTETVRAANAALGK